MRKIIILCTLCVCIVNVQASDGALKGVFSINSNGERIVFSQGNLQHQASTKTWRFSNHQYDIVGEDNSNISSTNDGWIDLFGWGTSGYDNTIIDPFAVYFQPWDTSTSTLEEIYLEYSSIDVNKYGYGPSTFCPDPSLTGTSANYDWGVFNAISNGGNQTGLWRTLSYEELFYILYTRPQAQHLGSLATVCGVHGYVLLPDNFTLPQGISWTYQANGWDINTYDDILWSTLENSGAVFLPAAGGRFGTEINNVGEWGGYWLASVRDGGGAKSAYFGPGDIVLGNHIRYRGRSVRLVQEYIEQETPTLIDDIAISITSRKLLRNGQIFILRGDKTYTLQGQEVK